MGRILLIFISITSVACMPHKFDVYYSEESGIYQMKLNQVKENNKLKIKNHEKRNIEIKSGNKELERKNFIPKGIEIDTIDHSNHFLIHNRTNKDLFVEFEKSSIIKKNKSYRVVSGETRNRDVNLTVPNQIIAANSSAKVSFYISELRADLSQTYDRIIISLQTNDRSYRIERLGEINKFPLDLEKEPDIYLGRISYLSKTEKYLCGFTFMFFGGFCWLIVNADESDFDAASKVAASKFNVPSEELFLTEVNSSKSVILSDITN